MSRKGFTLIELLVVISIIALLSSVVMAALNTARDKGRIAAGKSFDANAYHAAGDQALAIWDFDECSGTSAADRTGNGNTASVATGLWSTDTPWGTGCSILLNGTSDYASVVNTGTLDVSSTFTVTAWIKPSATPPATWNMIVAGGFNDWGFGYNGGSNTIRLTKVSAVDAPNSSLAISRQAWHQVAMVYSNGVVAYYLDGQADGSGSFAQTFTPTQKRIGMSSAYGAYFSGNLDSIKIYGKDLSASEVGRLYAEEKARQSVARR